MSAAVPCACCEAPGALFDVGGRRFCGKCAAEPVLVAAFSEGVLRAAGQEVVLAPRVPVSVVP